MLRAFFILAILCASASAQAVARRGAGVVAAPAGLSVIDGTQGGPSASTTIIAAHDLNLATHDQLWIAVYWTNSSTCAAQTITLSDTAVNTFATVTGSSRVLDQWAGASCIAQYTVLDAIANSADTIQVVLGDNVGTVTGFEVLQMRGTANAQADQVSSFDSSTSPASTGVTGSVTTTVADAIVGAAIFIPFANTLVPTASGCMGVTGTEPANTGSGSRNAAIQYVKLSSTTTGTCSFTIGGTSVRILQGAVFH